MSIVRVSDVRVLMLPMMLLLMMVLLRVVLLLMMVLMMLLVVLLMMMLLLMMVMVMMVVAHRGGFPGTRERGRAVWWFIRCGRRGTGCVPGRAGASCVRSCDRTGRRARCTRRRRWRGRRRGRRRGGVLREPASDRSPWRRETGKILHWIFFLAPAAGKAWKMREPRSAPEAGGRRHVPAQLLSMSPVADAPHAAQLLGHGVEGGGAVVGRVAGLEVAVPLGLLHGLDDAGVGHHDPSSESHGSGLRDRSDRLLLERIMRRPSATKTLEWIFTWMRLWHR